MICFQDTLTVSFRLRLLTLFADNIRDVHNRVHPVLVLVYLELLITNQKSGTSMKLHKNDFQYNVHAINATVQSIH